MQETVDQRRIQREISILRRLTHGSIIQLLEIVETEHYIFLVSVLRLPLHRQPFAHTAKCTSAEKFACLVRMDSISLETSTLSDWLHAWHHLGQHRAFWGGL